jgi:hypothetical protein
MNFALFCSYSAMLTVFPLHAAEMLGPAGTARAPHCHSAPSFSGPTGILHTNESGFGKNGSAAPLVGTASVIGTLFAAGALVGFVVRERERGYEREGAREREKVRERERKCVRERGCERSREVESEGEREREKKRERARESERARVSERE